MQGCGWDRRSRPVTPAADGWNGFTESRGARVLGAQAPRCRVAPRDVSSRAKLFCGAKESERALALQTIPGSVVSLGDEPLVELNPNQVNAMAGQGLFPIRAARQELVDSSLVA